MELKPGYKQTEVGVIPETWNVKPLTEITIKVIDNRGKTPPISKTQDIELIETASISFVSREPDYNKVTKYVSSTTYKNWFRGHPEPNDILVSTVGEYSGSTALYQINRGTIAQNLIALRITNSIDSSYVFSWTRSLNFRVQLDQVMMNQAQPSLRVPWLLNFKIPLPPSKAEQRAIATALSDADALLDGLDRLIAKKRDLKQAAMQQLLTGETRLPGFEGEWDVKRLGELFEITSSKRVFQSEWKYEGIPFYRARELAVLGETGRVDNELFITKSLYVAFKTAHGVPEPGDMLVTGVGTLGKVYVVTGDHEFYFKDGNIIWFKIRGSVSPEFLRQLFLTKVVMKQITDAAAGTTVGTYTISGAKKTEIPFPPLPEQTAIATVLSDMDAEITTLEQRRNKTKDIKQAMMQELLTGKTRLVTPVENAHNMEQA